LRQTLIFWLFKPFNFKRRVSSHFVAKTTTCCICMWKLESKAKGSFGQKEFYFSNMGETALEA
jgi:hypothetical protein